MSCIKRWIEDVYCGFGDEGVRRVCEGAREMFRSDAWRTEYWKMRLCAYVDTYEEVFIEERPDLFVAVVTSVGDWGGVGPATPARLVYESAWNHCIEDEDSNGEHFWERMERSCCEIDG